MGLRRGLFITFEGIEGSGKTTQMKRLYDALRKLKYRVIMTQEPGGNPLGKKIRELLVGKSKNSIFSETELFLFLADRVNHVREVITPALRRKEIVLCDRFADSTIAYQGFGRNLPQKVLEGMNKLATGGLKPDLTLFLDLPVREGLKRLKGRKSGNRLDHENAAFFNRVRKGYFFLARKNPRISVLNGAGDPQRVHQEILQKVKALLG